MKRGAISIHSLRAEGDDFMMLFIDERMIISIHSLRAEGDNGKLFKIECGKYFNPLPPCGGRLCRYGQTEQSQ